jgi:peptidoglycan DL-endopeptidase CwlO
VRRSRRSLIRLVQCLAAAVVVAAPTLAHAEPQSVRAKRAQVAQLQRQLEAVGIRVEAAAERYNGARWRFEGIQSRIVQNQRDLTTTQANLGKARTRLTGRLRALYRQPDPSPAVVLLSSGSITAATEQLRMLNRIGQQDIDVVQSVKSLKQRIIVTREKLVKDRGKARVQLAARTREKRAIEGLLRQRQRVLNAASGELRRAIAQEQARVRQQAERTRRAAIAAQAPIRGDGASGSGPTVALTGSLPSGSGNAEAARIALQYQGVPYVWGGATPSGFDCSGLASYAFAKVGKSVPHYTGAIWAAFPRVPYDQLQAGDLVFFHGLGHMGIYIGNGQMVHAPHTGDVVRIANMADRAGSYVGAVRP